MEISGGWRLLWSGRVTVNNGRLFVRIIWGPPIIWRPRYDSYRFDIGRGWQFGLGWWVLIVGWRVHRRENE